MIGSSMDWDLGLFTFVDNKVDFGIDFELLLM